jgi:hypothetical protein
MELDLNQVGTMTVARAQRLRGAIERQEPGKADI